MTVSYYFHNSHIVWYPERPKYWVSLFYKSISSHWLLSGLKCFRLEANYVYTRKLTYNHLATPYGFQFWVDINSSNSLSPVRCLSITHDLELNYCKSSGRDKLHLKFCKDIHIFFHENSSQPSANYQPSWAGLAIVVVFSTDIVITMHRLESLVKMLLWQKTSQHQSQT